MVFLFEDPKHTALHDCCRFCIRRWKAHFTAEVLWYNNELADRAVACRVLWFIVFCRPSYCSEATIHVVYWRHDCTSASRPSVVTSHKMRY